MLQIMIYTVSWEFVFYPLPRKVGGSVVEGGTAKEFAEERDGGDCLVG